MLKNGLGMQQKRDIGKVLFLAAVLFGSISFLQFNLYGGDEQPDCERLSRLNYNSQILCRGQVWFHGQILSNTSAPLAASQSASPASGLLGSTSAERSEQVNLPSDPAIPVAIIFITFLVLLTIALTRNHKSIFFDTSVDVLINASVPIILIIAGVSQEDGPGKMLLIGLGVGFAVIYSFVQTFRLNKNSERKWLIPFIAVSRIVICVVVPALILLIWVISAFCSGSGQRRSRSKRVATLVTNIALTSAAMFFLKSLINGEAVRGRGSYNAGETSFGSLEMQLVTTPALDQNRENISFEIPQNASCPYCSQVFDNFPKRSRKCPKCGEYVYRVRDYKNGVYQLLTVKDYEKKARLTADKEWADLNRRVAEHSKSRDWDSLSYVYFQMALQLREEGKDFFSILQESARFSLRRFQEDGIKRVKISDSGDASCPACRKKADKVCSVDVALKEMPLPCKDCTFDLHNIGSQMGWCRCRYIGLLDGQ